MTPGVGNAAIPMPLPVPPKSDAITADSTKTKILLVNEGIQLGEEQVQAEVKYYEADLETNAELDAITAQVVADLKLLTGGDGTLTHQASKSDNVEIEL